MSLNCRIDGGKVLAPNGKESILYKDLVKTLGESKAMDYYALTENEDYQPINNVDSNNEMSLNTFMQYASTKQTNENFSQERLDLQFRTENISRLNDLYENGIFSPSKTNLENTGIFTKDEIEGIVVSEEIQKNLKSFIDNLESDNILPIDNPQKKKSYNKVGFRPIENPTVTENYILEKTYTATTIEEVDSLIESIEDKDVLEKYKSDSEYRDYIRELSIKTKELPVEYTPGETLEKILKTLDVTQLDNINKAASEILINNNNKEVVLDEFDNVIDSFADAGVEINLDSTDYQNKPLEWFKNFVRNTLEFSTQLTIEKAESFANYLDSIIKKPNRKKTTIKNTQNVKTLKYLDTTLNEVEVFEQYSFIKQEENIYQKVKDYSLEDMYSIFYDILKANNTLVEMQEDFDMSDVENYVRSRMNEFPEASSEILEKIIMYKTVFKSPFSNSSQNGIVTPKENEQYLKEDFVLDFSKKYVRNKLDKSEDYNNFYKFLKIDNKGIRPIDNTEYTTLHILNNAPKDIKKNLINYFSLSKNTIFTSESTEQPIENKARLNAVQNPFSIAKVKEDYQIVNENEIISKKGENFIRVRDEIYEAVTSNGANTLYSKITDTNSEFHNTTTEKPTTEMSLEELGRFNKTEENTITYKEYISKKDIEEINEKEFNCKI